MSARAEKLVKTSFYFTEVTHMAMFASYALVSLLAKESAKTACVAARVVHLVPALCYLGAAAECSAALVEAKKESGQKEAVPFWQVPFNRRLAAVTLSIYSYITTMTGTGYLLATEPDASKLSQGMSLWIYGTMALSSLALVTATSLAIANKNDPAMPLDKHGVKAAKHMGAVNLCITAFALLKAIDTQGEHKGWASLLAGVTFSVYFAAHLGPYCHLPKLPKLPGLPAFPGIPELTDSARVPREAVVVTLPAPVPLAVTTVSVVMPGVRPV